MIGDPSEGRYIEILDTRLWVLEMGEGHPLLVLHGGPGMDHTQFRPWLDPLAGHFRLIYVDLRSQGRSDLAESNTLTLRRMASDISELAAEMGLERYAVLGHSFGSFVALQHAVDHGAATHYVLIGCVPSARWLDRIEIELAGIEPPELRDRITASWDREAKVETVAEFREILRDQLPFHFADPEGEACREFLAGVERMQLAPDVLRTLASGDYGAIEVEDRLGEITAPVLVIAAEYDRVTTSEAGWSIAEAAPKGECVLIKDAGHMMFAEKPKAVRRAIVEFFERYSPPA